MGASTAVQYGLHGSTRVNEHWRLWDDPSVLVQPRTLVQPAHNTRRLLPYPVTLVPCKLRRSSGAWRPAGRQSMRGPCVTRALALARRCLHALCTQVTTQRTIGPEEVSRVVNLNSGEKLLEVHLRRNPNHWDTKAGGW